MSFWRIYYGDGSLYTSKDGTPWDAPRLDVQVVVQGDDRVGWRWVSGGDFFTYEEDRSGWNTTSYLYDHLIRARRPCILFGRQMADDEWMRLFLRVKAEIGEKQGWLTTEDRR